MPFSASPSKLALLAALPLATACSSSAAPPVAPDGLTCKSVVDGGSGGASLTTALASAAPGACVLVGGATYTGAFVVPAGVSLASAKGARATLTGGTAS